MLNVDPKGTLGSGTNPPVMGEPTASVPMFVACPAELSFSNGSP